MNQKSKRNSPHKYTQLEYPFSCSPSRISLNSSPLKKSNRSVYASPFASPRNHTNNNSAIQSIIEEVKIHHQEIINEMDINHHNDYQSQNLRISKLVLETLWIHFLGKSFKLEDVVGDVASILDGVKELKSDWSMMIKHYEGLQRKIARRIYEQDIEGDIDQAELILDLQRIILKKEENELKIDELEKQIHSLQFLHSKQNKQPILLTSFKSKKQKMSSSISPSKNAYISKRIQLLHKQVFDSSELVSDHSLQQSNREQNSNLVEDNKQCQLHYTLPFMSKQCSKQETTNISNMFFSQNSQQIQICQQSKKCIKQLIEIRQELGQQLQSNKNLLQSSLQILSKAKKFIISYVMGNSKKKIFIRKGKQNSTYQNKQTSRQKIDGIVQEIQKIQKMVSEKCKQKIGSINSIINSHKILSQNNDQDCVDERLMEDKIIQNQIQNIHQNQSQMSSSSLSESMDYQKQIKQKQKISCNSADKAKTLRISKQTRFILLEQDLCKSLQQLSKQKIQNKIIKENLLKKQKQIAELFELNEKLTSELSNYKGSFGQFRTPRNSFKPSQGLLAISQLIEEPQQNDITQKPQIQSKQIVTLAGRRSNKLKSLFQCFFPEQEDQKTTIKQIQNLRRQIQNYNQNQQFTTIQAQGQISPLQMVILSIQNLLEHLATVEQSQQHNILFSLRDQVTQITDQILEQSQISPSQYQQYIKVIIQKVYDQTDTPIRRVIEEFVYYLQGKNSEQILYLTEQFVRNIGKIEFGESNKSSLQNSRRDSQVISRAETPRNSQIIQTQ